MFLLWILALIGVVFVLYLRSRVSTLEWQVRRQRDDIESLSDRLNRLRREAEKQEAARPPTISEGPVTEAAPQPEPAIAETPEPLGPAAAYEEPPPPVEEPPRPPAVPSVAVAPPGVSPPAAPPIVPPPLPAEAALQAETQVPPPLDRRPPAAPEPAPVWNVPSINWEELVGVKLFSAVAGIALVLAAVFFLRYTIDLGLLTPAVRVAIGLIVATALLVLCELKAARKYPVTANALDAASVAILFSTFFAAHALWNLVGTPATFGLLILVTVLAVLLSIRHDSRFIAVLGLLGGFATPALLSTGTNQPIPLFSYLLLLNAGLAWVAFKKGWPVLTILTLVFTTIYQWGWVVTFLDTSQLSLAMGIFLLFGVMSFAALILGRRGLERAGTGTSERVTLALERTGLAAAVMPLAFAVYLAAVPAFGASAGLLFGFLLVLDAGLLAIAAARGEEVFHAIGGLATLLVFAIWLSVSYAAGTWLTATLCVAIAVAFYAIAPAIAARFGRPFSGVATRAIYVAPILLFVFPVLTRIEPATATPWVLFGTLYVLLALLAWRALTLPDPILFFLAAFFGLVAEASWSATYLTTERLGAAVLMYAIFGVFYLGVPVAARRLGRPLEPRWGAGAVVLASLLILLFLAAGPRAPAGLWGMAFLLALLNAGLFVESAAGRMPVLSIAGSVLSWLVLGVWWARAAAVVGVMPSLVVLLGLTLVMLAGYAWGYMKTARSNQVPQYGGIGFPTASSLGLVGHLFLLAIFLNPAWSTPPWPALGALFVMTLAVSATALYVRWSVLHAAATAAAAAIVAAWVNYSAGNQWAWVGLLVGEAAIAYGTAWLWIARRLSGQAPAVGATLALFVGELTVIGVSTVTNPPPLPVLSGAHVVNLSLILWLAWTRRWRWVSSAAVIPAFFAAIVWADHHLAAADWTGLLAFAASMYAVFVAYPFVLGRRARASRDPYFTAIAGSAFFFIVAQRAFHQGNLGGYVGIIPVFEGLVLAVLLRALLRAEPPGDRDLGRLAIVAGSALAFATVAIPLQLRQQWITIGWALEGAALAWLYRRIRHRGLLYAATALLGVVFVRLAANPAVFVYEPRGLRVFNWYLYAYLICSVAMFVAAWWLSRTDDRLGFFGESFPRVSVLLPSAGVILLFLLLNIEIADFYATGPEITFRFGVSIAQDLTYTVGWLIFGLALLAAGIYLHNRPGRMASVALIAVTMFKAFLYDMRNLEGLSRVASLVGLAVSLSLVALALQKFVLQAPKEGS